MSDVKPVLAILGGTGALGSALAARWATAGYSVIVGSRSREKAEAAAAGSHRIRGATNDEAAKAADVIVVAVPFASHDQVLDEIRDSARGKVVIDAVVPLQPPKVSRVHIPAGTSAAQRAQQRLGADVSVVSAFHNVSAASLREGAAIDCDVLVFGDDAAGRARVVALCEAIGLRGIEGGPLANSVAAEALTAVLIGINRRYGARHAGVRITGLASGTRA
jgi:NADPH-dependent F420 reductase